MSLLPTRPNRVDLLVTGRRDEAICVPTTLAVGALAELVPVAAQDYNAEVQGIQAASSINKRCEKLFVLEDGLKGYPKDHLDPWLITEPVQYLIANPGDVIFALLAAGQNVPRNAKLVSVGDGTLQAAPTNNNLYTDATDSTAITATASETAFDNSYTIPAAYLRVGDQIRIRVLCTATATHTTDTLNVKLKIGSQVIIATGAVDNADADVVSIDVVLTVHAVGATGSISGRAGVVSGVAGSALVYSTVSPLVIDTTGTLALTATATWSSNNAGNSVKMTSIIVDDNNVDFCIGQTMEALDNSAGGAAVFVRTRVW